MTLSTTTAETLSEVQAFLPQSPTFINSPKPSSSAPPSPPTTTLRIYTLCIANFGISFIWSLEFTLTTPFFQHTLRSSRVTSHLVWILGPVSGLIVAPLVGYYSDRCTSRYGRRRPFIFIGSLFAILGIMLFCNAPQIITFFGLTKMMIIPLAVLGFGIMDFAINAVMWPVRSLQGDLIENHLQHHVQGANIAMGSFGDLMSNILLSLFNEPVTMVRIVFGIGIIVFTISIAVILIAGNEKQWLRDDDSVIEINQASVENGHTAIEHVNVLHASDTDHTDSSDKNKNSNGDDGDDDDDDDAIYMFGLPRWFWKLGFVYFLSSASFFAIVPNISSWMGESVMGGDSNAPEHTPKARLYEKGVALYGKASLVRSIIQIIFSVTYPIILKAFNNWVGGLLGVASLGAGLAILLFASTTNPILVLVLVALLAVAVASFFTLPVALVVSRSGESTRGAYLGALNVFAVLPQLLDTTYLGVVSSLYGERWVMRIGACWAILAALASFCML